MKTKSGKGLCAILFAAVMAAALLIHAVPASAAEKEYDVIFRAGSRGTIGGQKSVQISVPYGMTLSQYDAEIESIIQSVTADDNYLFTGFESRGTNLNEVTVEKKTILVAKYKRAVDALEYKINFVDTDGNPVATATAGMANRGDRVQVYARSIEGYTTDTPSQEVTITEDGQEINVVYQAADPGTITQVEEVTQVRPGTAGQTAGAGTAAGTTAGGTADRATAGTAAGGTAAGTTNGGGTAEAAGGETAAAEEGTAGGETTTIEDEETPLGETPEGETDGTTEIEEEETPLAEDAPEEQDSSNYGLGIGVAVVAVIVLAGIIILVKKR